jgi:diaminopimelate decarboxylase
VSTAALLSEHGSPLWLVDVDRVRERLAGFREAWAAAWPAVEVAYSYKTNRTTALLRALAAEGAGAEVVCAAEYALARDVVGVPGDRVTVNGPHKPDALLDRAAADGALVVADSPAELDRIALAGVARAGLRVGLAGSGGTPSRFGIEPEAIPAAARRLRELGVEVEVLHVHLVSTDFAVPLSSAGTLGHTVRVGWAKPPAVHADAARLLARLARELGIGAVDLGGGLPAAPAVGRHAAAVASALREADFDGRLMLEPGRALVADAVDLACTVVAVKELPGGGPCAVLDAGTNLLPGALWGWPRFEALAPRHEGAASAPVLLSGPLCLNVDVVHPAATVGAIAPGDVLVAREVGAYQQVQSTQFGDVRPAVAVREGGRWRLHRRREELADLIRQDQEEPSWSA